MNTQLKAFPKEYLIEKFREIYAKGWIKNVRGRNDGAVGNTLEDLLGIRENNLPIPNASEWELKAQKSNTSALLTLFHLEPSPRAMKIVTNILLNQYGWQSTEVGEKYPTNEMSFRSTLNTKSFSDRGFKVFVNDNGSRVEIMFDGSVIDQRHSKWKENILAKVGHLNGVKLTNCFYVQADEKWELEKGKRCANGTQ